MKLGKIIRLIATHTFAIGIGFMAGIYALPILIAPDSPTEQALAIVAQKAIYKGQFIRGLEDSDALHWGEGEVFVSEDEISLNGSLSPGPDFRLYLSPKFVETEAGFEALKSQMVEVGAIKTFNGFLISVPSGIDTSKYSAVIIWCERFGEFITAAEYS